MIYVLGTKIDDISKEQALQKVSALMSERQPPTYIVTPNPEICLQAEADEDYQDILNRSFLSLPDGFGLKLGALLLGQRLKHRVTGVDFVSELMKLSAEKGWRVFLFGATTEVVERCREVLMTRHQNLQIVGICEGENKKLKIKNEKYKLKIKDTIINEINESGADILLVALGAPLQEKWIAENLNELTSVKLAIGVGGTFDFIAGKVKRAPQLFRRLGLEWLWRLIMEPQRVRRIYRATLKFTGTVLKWRLRMRFKYRPNVVGLIIDGPILRQGYEGLRGCSSVVECLLPKQKIAGSIPVTRSSLRPSSYGWQATFCECKKCPPKLHAKGGDIELLLVERADEPGHWQLPQGGIQKGETAAQAIKREMKEELGSESLQIIKHVAACFSYEWPKFNRLRQGYRGQRQDLFILEYTGAPEDIKPDADELAAARWCDLPTARATIHPLRAKQLETFLCLLA